MLHEALVGKNSGLTKAIYALSNFNKDVFIVNKRGKIVLFHDIFVDLIYRDSHVLITVKGCAKV